MEEYLFQFKAIHLVQFKCTVVAPCSTDFSVWVTHLRKNSSKLNGRFVYLVTVTVALAIKTSSSPVMATCQLCEQEHMFFLRIQATILNF
jgi:hypothetical protein